MCHGLSGLSAALYWTPVDWAWTAGLFSGLLCPWHYGMPVLVVPGTFQPARAIALMATYGVRHTFLPPAALRLMQLSGLNATNCQLSSIVSGGERVGAELVEWTTRTFGVSLHEGYGQTECGAVVGHDVRIINEQGEEVRRGEPGILGVRLPDPVVMSGYWKDSAATQKKLRGGYCYTGDIAIQDTDGYLWYVGREDELIKNAGHRVGPADVEAVICEHCAVASVAVAGMPDAITGQHIKAWIVLKAGYPPTTDLVVEIGRFVRGRLAAHERPREIVFVEALPMTQTGKVNRRQLHAMAADRRS
jgi:acetyl-CoA synthetase